MAETSKDVLFSVGRSGEEVKRPPRCDGSGLLARLGLADVGFVVLRLLGFGHLAMLLLTLLAALGRLPPSWASLVDYRLQNPGLGLNVFLRDVFLALVAFLGAFNRRLRLVAALFCGFSYLVVAVGAALFAEVASDAAARAELLRAAVVQSCLVLLSLAVALSSRAEAVPLRRDVDYPNVYSPSRSLMRGWLTALAVIELGLFGFALWSRWHHTLAIYAGPDLALVENLSKFLLLTVLCGLMAYNDELRETFYPLLLQELGLGTLTATVWLLFGIDGKTDAAPHPVLGLFPFYGGFILSEGSFALLAGLFRGLYYDMELRITTLSPGGARGALALHDALFPSSESDEARLLDADSGAVIEAVDRFAATIRSRKRGLFALPFFLLEYVMTPLYGARPPFSTMSRAERSWFLKRRVLGPGKGKSTLRRLLFRIFGAAHGIIVFAHYSGRYARSGLYVPPDARRRLQPDVPQTQAPDASLAPLPQGPDDAAGQRPRSSEPERLAARRLGVNLGACQVPKQCDFLVIGSGAGGAVAAYRLAQAFPGKSIVVVERGPHLSPLSDFSGDELEMVSKLYKEGGLQQSRRFGITLLQAECVGGGTMVNNAVCLPMPETTQRVWRDEFGLGPIVDALPAEYARIAAEIGINDVPESAVNQKVAERFMRGVARLGDELEPASLVKVNASLVQGTGEWNLGDRDMRKHTALQTYLAWAHGLTAASPSPLCLLAETSALRFETTSDGRRARSVLLQRAFDAVHRIEVREAVVVAAGVVASSHFLMRSGCSQRLPDLGRHVSCNLGLPAFFEFGEIIDAFDGLEITHGARARHVPAVFETHFLTPGMFSLAVPFFFDRLRDTLGAYRRLSTFGCLISSDPNGRVLEKRGLDDSPLDWQLSQRDLSHLAWALGTQVKLGRGADARRVVLSTNPGMTIDLQDEAEVERFLKDLEAAAPSLAMEDFRLTTAHPQGGNRLGGPSVASRVVDLDFRVRGYDNVFVADASLFPSGVGTNPQWTVMALASLAADSVVRLSSQRT